MRRLVPLRVATAILAFIGLVWIVAAGPTVEMLCSNRLTLVRYHAMVAEKRGNWLDAAHDYAHLLEYETIQKTAAAPASSTRTRG
jgi:hypothetical protein